MTGLSSSFLSRFETGITVPSISTLQMIADQLKIDIGYLFQTAENNKFVLSRKGNRTVYEAERGSKGEVTYEVELLAEGFNKAFMDPIIATIAARDHDSLETVQHGGQELLLYFGLH